MSLGSVLVTGGTGFFGQGFVRRLLRDSLSDRICIYSRDEHKQAAMREAFKNDERLRWFVGDVRDSRRLRRAMHGVDVVIHAAALKRIEVGQYNPEEMLHTNVHGSINVIDAASDRAVGKVVFLSTDKAYQPVSPYGFSKAMAESLFLAANNTHSGTRFSVTRYGNIAGSTGSVIPRWREILKHSDTVPVTDPDCTRFWMALDEAIDLVLSTIEKMPDTPAIPILPSFRIGDLAKAMGAKMSVSGLSRWEKMHESMAGWSDSFAARRMSVHEIREELRNV